MKNLTKNLVIAGMIGLGSLGIFGNSKSYGQEILDSANKFEEERSSRSVKVSSMNHQEYQIEDWAELRNGEIVLTKYFDTNRDGKFDSFSVFAYLSDQNKIMNTKDSSNTMEVLRYPNWIKKNIPLGKSFWDCEEGYFKQNLNDYIKTD